MRRIAVVAVVVGCGVLAVGASQPGQPQKPVLVKGQKYTVAFSGGQSFQTEVVEVLPGEWVKCTYKERLITLNMGQVAFFYPEAGNE